MHRIQSAVVVAAVAAAALFAGCGGSGQDAALSKAEFTRQANAICLQAAKERSQAYQKALAAHGSSTPSPAEEIELAEEIFMPPLRKMVSALGDLPVPADGERLGEAVAAFEAGMKKIEEDSKNVLRAETFYPARVKARASGLTECTQF